MSLKEIKRNEKIYSLYTNEKLSLREIAKLYNLSYERVRQILMRIDKEHQALDKKQ